MLKCKWIVCLAVLSLIAAGCEKEEVNESADEAKESAAADSPDDEGKAKPGPDKQSGPFQSSGAVSLEGTEVSGQAMDVIAGGPSGTAFVAIKEAPGVGLLAEKDGALTVAPTVKDGKLEGATELFWQDGGKKLAAVNKWAKDGVKLFDVDAKKGVLSNRKDIAAPVQFDNAITPDGQFFYSVPPRENTITIAKRNGDAFEKTGTAELGLTSDNESGSSQFLAISPDGKHLYATTNKKFDKDRKQLADHRLYVYALDAKSGKLEEVEHYEHDKDKLPLYQPKSLAVSPDGKYVAVGFSRSFVGQASVFERDAKTGKLKYVTTGKFVGKGELSDKLIGPDGLAFSSDSKKLYVAEGDLPAVVAFDMSL